ncbi:hypothetical protein COC42_10925 [Sphingomonas spermidinifaciens]|uniref:Glycerophosphoryl diester phosphodiesterase membrane domain-containing protein n=1 Tax=Sphingomonas spermidinifaciens TaxID=1141889 RepID=A0A2A4B2Y6_9SPHN|nr:hypothetical protein [Sphingomonas spermidinifaciens]PCD01996.1 hypothetical protein COC42_10925 [Sphingomonas spermidinifaciens]
MTVKMTRVWDATSEFLNERGGAVLALAAGMIFAPELVSGVLEQLAAPRTPTAVALQFVGMILSLVGAAGGLAVSALAIRPMAASEAARLGLRRLLPLVGVSVVLLVAAMIVALPFVGILIASGVDLTAFSTDGGAVPDLGGGVALGLVAYGLLYFGVFLWAFARLAVLGPVIVAERRGFSAIGRAWTLTRGHALRIIGVFILFGIVALILIGGIGFAAGVIGAIGGAGQPGFSIGGLFVAAVTAVVATLLSVVQSAFTAKLYTALAPATDLEDIFA